MTRSTRTRSRWLGVCLSLALALPVAAMAWPGGDRGGDRADRIQQKLDALDLDADTRAQVEAHFERAREGRKERKTELREAKHKLRDLMRSGTATETRLFEQAENVADLELERKKAKIASHLALRELLTPEQLETLRPRRHHGDGEEGDECSGKRRQRRDR